MKLNKKTALFIAIGVLVIALALVTMRSFGKLDEKDGLGKKLATSQSQLQAVLRESESLTSKGTELEGQLNQATAALEAAQAKLSRPVSSTSAAMALFAVASSYGLEVTEMTSSSPFDENLEKVNLSAIAMTAKLKGDVSGVVNLIGTLGTRLPTSIVKSVEITVPQASSGDNASASIELVIYTYRGD